MAVCILSALRLSLYYAQHASLAKIPFCLLSPPPPPPPQPGIGNSSKTDYIKSFVSYGIAKGFRVAILNHLGALEEVPLTGNRIYSYGWLKI